MYLMMVQCPELLPSVGIAPSRCEDWHDQGVLIFYVQSIVVIETDDAA